MISWIQKLFSSNPDASMKRLLGFASFVIACVLAFNKVDIGLVGSFLGFTGTMLAVSAFTKT